MPSPSEVRRGCTSSKKPGVEIWVGHAVENDGGLDLIQPWHWFSEEERARLPESICSTEALYRMTHYDRSIIGPLTNPFTYRTIIIHCWVDVHSSSIGNRHLSLVRLCTFYVYFHLFSFFHHYLCWAKLITNYFAMPNRISYFWFSWLKWLLGSFTNTAAQPSLLRTPYVDYLVNWNHTDSHIDLCFCAGKITPVHFWLFNSVTLIVCPTLVPFNQT